MHRPRQTRFGESRKGAAIAELAVVLPIFVMISIGTIELSQVIFLKQCLQAAAHDCGYIASRQSATDAELQSRMTEILSARGINGGTISTIPSSIDGLDRGTRYTVTVSAPTVTNTVIGEFFMSAVVTASTVRVKEL